MELLSFCTGSMRLLWIDLFVFQLVFFGSDIGTCMSLPHTLLEIFYSSYYMFDTVIINDLGSILIRRYKQTQPSF
jgi:hypothetical protein